jgi:hypothetical protein
LYRIVRFISSTYRIVPYRTIHIVNRKILKSLQHTLLLFHKVLFLLNIYTSHISFRLFINPNCKTIFKWRIQYVSIISITTPACQFEFGAFLIMEGFKFIVHLHLANLFLYELIYQKWIIITIYNNNNNNYYYYYYYYYY